MTEAANLRKKRGTVRASITRLTTRLHTLEAGEKGPTTPMQARQMRGRLESLDSDFKTYHFALIDTLHEEDEEGLTREQAILDQHDDDIADISIRIEALLLTTAPEPDTRSVTDDRRVIATRRLKQLQERLTTTDTAISSLSADVNDVYQAYLHQDELTDFKRELSHVRSEVVAFVADDSDELTATIRVQERQIFDLSLKIKKLLHNPSHVNDLMPTAQPSESKGVKLPKIDVPTFDGELLHWQTFWEQFCIAIHDRKDVSNTEKLVYLRHSLKDGSAKSIVEGLSQSGDEYPEAVESLKARFNRPRLIHQAHVRKIYEAPNLREGTGKELRHLHDTVQQHLRALKAMGEEPSGSFVTSLLELKLDQNTMFEWQKASQDCTDVPHYKNLLEFLNLRAQASETCLPEKRHPKYKSLAGNKPITSFTANVSDTTTSCVVCKSEKHPLYVCTRFKGLTHDKMLSTVRSNNLCLNCLRPGHMSKNCTSIHRCRKCQKPHHTLLHNEAPQSNNVAHGQLGEQSHASVVAPVSSSNIQAGSSQKTLLMTCQLLVNAPNGSCIRVRGLLDSGSSTSFVSERVVQSLHLSRSSQTINISGIAGISHKSPLHSVADFSISPVSSPSQKLEITAVVVPRVTCDLPLQPIHLHSRWNHLTDLHLADPDFGRPGKIDILLGVDIYADVLLQGWRSGPPGSPVAFETKFGWILAGKTGNLLSACSNIASHHVAVASGDELLHKFWEIEENPNNKSNLSPEERTVVQHFNDHHTRTESGRFVVPLPKNPHAKQLGESRAQAIRRFLSLERSLHSKGQFQEFSEVMEEYMKLGHAQPVPPTDLNKSSEKVFYLPMHAVRKESSTTTKIRAVFDASAKSSTGVSLNDTLLVGPTIHPPLIDVLLRFRLHRVALTADISKMYRAIELAYDDRDLHRFVWRKNPDDTLIDYRMTRVTFGVSASSFAANMAVKQNALDFAMEYPRAAEVVKTSFYVDDGLTGADSIEEAAELQQELQELFSKGGFLLRKWNSSDQRVLCKLTADLKDSQPMQMIPISESYTKTLGIEWNASKDHFRLNVTEPPQIQNITKRGLVSDIAKTYDVLGWFSPSTIKVKILLQKLWEQKIDWDDLVPTHIRDAWLKWRSELHLLSKKHIPRCYYSKKTSQTVLELHGFSDASEAAYAAVVYLRFTDKHGKSQTSLVISKTKVAPLKRLTIPRLELCGAHLLSQLLHHVRQVLDIPLSRVYAWSDSTIVLNWLDGSPKRFKTYVGNRISTIIDLIPPGKWRHVNGMDNPADCASRGLYPSELLHHTLWWNGPTWLKETPAHWPQEVPLPPNQPADEEKEISLHVITTQTSPIIPTDKYSNFNHLKHVTAWCLRFIKNCQIHNQDKLKSPSLSAQELQQAEYYWLQRIQDSHFEDESSASKVRRPLNSSSPLISLRPFIDSSNLLRVGGRQQLSKIQYQSQHPIILHWKHPLTRLLIRTEHIRLLHAGPTLLTASLARSFHIIGGKQIVPSVIRKCITCHKNTAKPQPQILGHLPIEHITPGSVFDKVGVDYAGPVFIKYGYGQKPTLVKTHICVFVSLAVKFHLELVTGLSTEHFLVCSSHAVVVHH